LHDSVVTRLHCSHLIVTFRTDTIQATEGIIDALGEPVSYTPSGGDLVTITGVFESEYYDATGAGFASLVPIMSVKSSSGTFREGDVFVIESTTYGVVAVEIDSDGLSKCILEKRSA